MTEMQTAQEIVEIHPLTTERWDDLAALFGPNGADGGCWDMFWRWRPKDYMASNPDLNREALKALASRERAPGLLAYVEGKPVGWCSVGPRGDYAHIEHSAVIKPVDDKPVWCVVCFFIDPEYRGQHVATALLRAAVQFAREHGALAVEGYPVKIEAGKVNAKAAYCGTDRLFAAAGFKEIAVTGAKSGGRPRVVMRCDIGAHRQV